MKRFTKKAAAAAVVFSAALNLTGCVYGPPIDDGEEQQIPYGYITEEGQIEDGFDPSDNIAHTVYGPPVAE